MARIAALTGCRVAALSGDWRLAATAPGAVATPAGLDAITDWIPARVPGTAAEALRAAGRFDPAAPGPLHDRDVWYRAHFAGPGPRRLRLHGLATHAEVWLNGEALMRSDNMFHAHEIEAPARADNEIAIAFRALAPALAERRGRARWRARLVDAGGLRHVRTTFLGRMPGWCPSVHAVGPWRAIESVEETGPLAVRRADVRARLDGDVGALSVELSVEWRGGARPDATLIVEGRRAALAWTDAGTLRGELRIDAVEPWWPHTHGTPRLYAPRVEVGDAVVELPRVGFRVIEVDRGPDGAGFALRVNGVPVFCRGACWSSADIVALPASRDACAPWLARARDAGMNMVRIGGTMAYEGDAFFELCDELGLLVWQDFMFANLDYPANDDAFVESVRREAGQMLDRTQTSPSLAVLCGGSEVAQQAAMLGLPKATWGGPLFDAILPEVARTWRPDVPYVPNSPSGGDLPFSTGAGVTHYYGVGAYRRPLEDARRAEVRFASECLAFANVPEAATLAAAGVAAPGDAAWKAAVPRDGGADWDFDDVRDHYLTTLYGAVPTALRRSEPDRYLRLSRAVTGEVIEATIAEWRRPASSCGGALLWMLQDLRPGAGWGVVDSLGVPKAAWHALRRACRPVQLAMTDEGLDGLALHLTNETPAAIAATLSLVCLRDGAVPVRRARRDVALPARSARTISSADLIGAFFDVTYAYRFGAPQHDAVVATLADAATGAVLAEAFHFPMGRAETPVELGLAASIAPRDGGWALRLSTARLARSVHVDDANFRAAEEFFHLAPGVERIVPLVARIGAGAGATPAGEIHALNAASPLVYGRSS